MNECVCVCVYVLYVIVCVCVCVSVSLMQAIDVPLILRYPWFPLTNSPKHSKLPLVGTGNARCHQQLNVSSASGGAQSRPWHFPSLSPTLPRHPVNSHWGVDPSVIVGSQPASLPSTGGWVTGCQSRFQWGVWILRLRWLSD